MYRGADIDSDHRLVVYKVKLKWKKTGRETKCINVEMLKEEEIQERYSWSVHSAMVNIAD